MDVMEHLGGEIVTNVIGSIAGSGFALYFAKLYLNNALKDLTEVCEKVSDIEKLLSAFSVKIKKFDSYDNIIRQHEKKIAVLEFDRTGSQDQSQ